MEGTHRCCEGKEVSTQRTAASRNSLGSTVPTLLPGSSLTQHQLLFPHCLEMEGDWPLTSWPFPTMADALAQALALPACQPGCPGTFCMYAPGHQEKQHSSQKVLSLHLSLMDIPWHFGCVLTVPCFCLGEPANHHLGGWGDRAQPSSPQPLSTISAMPLE